MADDGDPWLQQRRLKRVHGGKQASLQQIEQPRQDDCQPCG